MKCSHEAEVETEEYDKDETRIGFPDVPDVIRLVAMALLEKDNLGMQKYVVQTLFRVSRSWRTILIDAKESSLLWRNVRVPRITRWGDPTAPPHVRIGSWYVIDNPVLWRHLERFALLASLSLIDHNGQINKSSFFVKLSQKSCQAVAFVHQVLFLLVQSFRGKRFSGEMFPIPTDLSVPVITWKGSSHVKITTETDGSITGIPKSINHFIRIQEKHIVCCGFNPITDFTHEYLRAPSLEILVKILKHRLHRSL